MYDWKKTAKKFGWALAEVVVAGAIVYITARPEWLGLIPIFEAIKNYIKHRWA